MKQLVCDMCGSTDLIKKDGVFVCQVCGTKYSVEEARKMMVEGTVSIKGAVKTKNDDFEVRAGELIAYHGAETNVVIPDSVKIIRESCFARMQEIESVTIPVGVHEIQYSAFSGCSRLEKIELPDSIQTLGYECFRGCTSLKSIRLPNSIQTLDGGCFSGCTSLESIYLPDSIQTLGERCFVGCKSLKSIRLPSSIEMLGSSCFGGCTSLKTIQLPNSIQTLSGGCFIGCTSLESIQLPNSIQTLGQQCFEGCTSLKSIQLPKNRKNIHFGSNCFEGCPTNVQEGCYIATAVYGSYDCPQVWTLRRFRDDTLAETWRGRAFIRAYYAISPMLVRWFGECGWFRNMWKPVLDRMVERLNNEGVEDTPYEDRNW